jgi:hypothetical protein
MPRSELKLFDKNEMLQLLKKRSAKKRWSLLKNATRVTRYLKHDVKILGQKV